MPGTHVGGEWVHIYAAGFCSSTLIQNTIIDNIKMEYAEYGAWYSRGREVQLCIRLILYLAQLF